MNFNILFSSLIGVTIFCTFVIVFIIYKQNRVIKNIFNLTSIIAKTNNIKKEIEKLKNDNFEVSEEVRLNSAIFYSTNDPICILDSNFNFLTANPAFENKLEIKLKDIKGSSVKIINSGSQDDDYYELFFNDCKNNNSKSFQMWIRNFITHESFYHLVNVTRIFELDSENVSQYILIFTDITDIKQNEVIIRGVSQTDHLTQLPNRSLFIDRLERSVSLAKRNSIVGAVMFLDLDHFKSLNDTLGHHVGDLLLKEIATRLNLVVRKTDTVSRLAGDEFTIILPEIAKSEDAAVVAEKIINIISEEYILEGNKIKTSCSLGIAIFPNDGDTVDALIHAADQAMYNVKKEGRNKYRFYSSSLDIEAHRKKELEKELVNATKENQFYLEYLPSYKNDDTVSYFDVLIRWKHPVLGDIKPSEFIPLAEESRLIIEITDWVIKKAFNDMKDIISELRNKNIKLSFKLSSIHFKQNDIVEKIVNLVGQENIKMVQIRIDEPIISKNLLEAKEKISSLLNQGFFICIDDFGTGKVSFLDLLDLKFNAVKIPRELIKNIDNENYEAAVKSLIYLAQNLNTFITIEGIENTEQLVKLKPYINDKMFMQGHYYSKELSKEELINII